MKLGNASRDRVESARMSPTYKFHDGDLPTTVGVALKDAGLVAWDIETSGLDWHKERIATCQVYAPEVGVHIVRIGTVPPRELISILENRDVTKLFHYALFDLAFMGFAWRSAPANVRCTKVASKILDPTRKEHSLQGLLHDHLGIEISKAERTSNWFATALSAEQLAYAARDVLFLPALFESLCVKLHASHKWSTAEKAFDFLPVQLQLDLWGCKDVFEY